MILIALGLVLSYRETAGYRLFVVQSGSMEPAIKTGSIVLVAKQSNYKVNDVITFFESLGSKQDLSSTFTHRILSINNVNGEFVYQTKGDANNGADKNAISQAHILGKVIFNAPYLGYIISFSRSQLGLIVLVVIPGTIIIYSELLSIKNEALKLISNRKKKKFPEIRVN